MWIADKENVKEDKNFFCLQWISNQDTYYNKWAKDHLVFMKMCPIISEHSQKLTPYLCQNNVALYFEPYWNQEYVADISFIKLKDWAFQCKRTKFFGWCGQKLWL